MLIIYENKDLFYDCNTKHHYKTRNKSNLLPEKIDFTYLQRNVQFSRTEDCNSFTEHIHNLTEQHLKNVLKKYLIKKAFYSVQDFFDDWIDTDLL